MSFDLSTSTEILSATPGTLRALLSGLSAECSASRNSSDWQPFDVVGHLIHGEETDWIPRARIILEQSENRTFVPFDRFAQFEKSQGKTLTLLLDDFERLRRENLATLSGWSLTDEQLDLEGIHTELGPVSLRQLLATWVVHDLNHIRQIVTVIASRYETEVGVWKEYLSILK